MKRFAKFSAASLSSCVLDLFLFAVFCRLLRGRLGAYIAVSTVLARLLSASYNYAMNYKVVFKSSEKVRTSGIKYVVLAAVQMSLSAVLVSGGKILLPAAEEVLIKVVVDSVLFLVSYAVQKRFVFRTGSSKYKETEKTGVQ